MKKRSRLKDYGLYFAISFVIVAVLVTLIVAGISETKLMLGTGLFFFGIFPFALMIENSRPYWKKRKLWLLLSGFLVIHFGGLAWAFSHDEADHHLGAVSVGVFVEMALFIRCRELLFLPSTRFRRL